MKIINKVPRRHQLVLDYMKAIEPVRDTIILLSTAIQLVAEGKTTLPDCIPADIKENKAFDGHHETKVLQKFLHRKRKLRLRVQRGYIDQRQGDPKVTLAKHLEMSDHFHVAFVSTRSLVDGYEFVINRDGMLHNGMSGASHFVTNW